MSQNYMSIRNLIAFAAAVSVAATTTWENESEVNGLRISFKANSTVSFYAKGKGTTISSLSQPLMGEEIVDDDDDEMTVADSSAPSTSASAFVTSPSSGRDEGVTSVNPDLSCLICFGCEGDDDEDYGAVKTEAFPRRKIFKHGCCGATVCNGCIGKMNHSTGCGTQNCTICKKHTMNLDTDEDEGAVTGIREQRWAEVQEMADFNALQSVMENLDMYGPIKLIQVLKDDKTLASKGPEEIWSQAFLQFREDKSVDENLKLVEKWAANVPKQFEETAGEMVKFLSEPQPEMVAQALRDVEAFNQAKILLRGMQVGAFSKKGSGYDLAHEVNKITKKTVERGFEGLHTISKYAKFVEQATAVVKEWQVGISKNIKSKARKSNGQLWTDLDLDGSTSDQVTPMVLFGVATLHYRSVKTDSDVREHYKAQVGDVLRGEDDGKAPIRVIDFAFQSSILSHPQVPELIVPGDLNLNNFFIDVRDKVAGLSEEMKYGLISLSYQHVQGTDIRPIDTRAVSFEGHILEFSRQAKLVEELGGEKGKAEDFGTVKKAWQNMEKDARRMEGFWKFKVPVIQDKHPIDYVTPGVQISSENKKDLDLAFAEGFWRVYGMDIKGRALLNWAYNLSAPQDRLTGTGFARVNDKKVMIEKHVAFRGKEAAEENMSNIEEMKQGHDPKVHTFKAKTKLRGGIGAVIGAGRFQSLATVG